MFWRANAERELYGTPTRASATRRRRRLQKSLTQIIRDGQLWRLLKEALLPEWNKFWKEVQPWDRRYFKNILFFNIKKKIFILFIICLDMNFFIMIIL